MNTVREYDCAICLQKCNYPTQLPCGHIFCFLCLKGVAIQSKRCALCRAEIPSDYLDHPDVLSASDGTGLVPHDTKDYQWFYEGRNGWWKYDDQSNDELESAYNNRDPRCKLLLAGAIYHIDFQKMMQMQSRDPRKRRRVRRDIPSLPAKGVAGVMITKIRKRQETRSESEDSSNGDTNPADEVISVDDGSDDDVQDENPVAQGNSLFGNLLRRFGALQMQGTDRRGTNTHGSGSSNAPPSNFYVGDDS